MSGEFELPFFERHLLLCLFGIAGLSSFFILIIGFSMISYTDTIPIVPRTVDSFVLVDGYTECVFVIDEKKYVSSEYPCKNKIGETVNTKLWNNRIIIVENK